MTELDQILGALRDTESQATVGKEAELKPRVHPKLK